MTDCSWIVKLVAVLSLCTVGGSEEQVTYFAAANAKFPFQSELVIYADRLQSAQSVFSRDYHSYDFCPLDWNWEGYWRMNFGQQLTGEKLEQTGYNLEFLQPQQCKEVCRREYTPSYSSHLKIEDLITAITLQYQHTFVLDNIPLQFCYDVVSHTDTHPESYCTSAVPVGCYVTSEGRRIGMCAVYYKTEPDSYYLFNHLDIEISYHPEHPAYPQSGHIVRAKVTPKSYALGSNCSGTEMFKLSSNLTSNLIIPYTYSVKWLVSDIKWTSRWALILDTKDQTIQWFSIMNSLIVVVFLTAVLAKVYQRIFCPNCRFGCSQWVKKLCRTQEEDPSETTGWKTLSEDVFRPPIGGFMLAALLGNGTQILCTAIVTLVLAACGVLSPSSRGSVVECLGITWLVMGGVAGYCAVTVYKWFGEKTIKQFAALLAVTALLCPGILFSMYFTLNGVHLLHHSSSGLPVLRVLALMARCLAGSIPCTVLGGVLAKCCKTAKPLMYSLEPRLIPTKRCYTRPLLPTLIGGILPFGTVFIQLFFMLNAAWGFQYYHLYGFLLMVSMICVLTVAETTILLCYFHLNAEDYRWWWRAFLSSGITGIYVYVYCVYYYFSKTDLAGVTNLIMYVSYMSMAAFLLVLATGTVGFFGCYVFVWKIYASLETELGSAYTVNVHNNTQHTETETEGTNSRTVSNPVGAERIQKAAENNVDDNDEEESVHFDTDDRATLI